MDAPVARGSTSRRRHLLTDFVRFGSLRLWADSRDHNLGACSLLEPRHTILTAESHRASSEVHNKQAVVAQPPTLLPPPTRDNS